MMRQGLFVCCQLIVCNSSCTSEIGIYFPFSTQSTEEDPSTSPKEEEVEDNVGSFRLVKGLNRFCLSHPGIYHLMPKSECHQFAQSVYQFKTSSSFPTLRISAVKHALNAEIHTDVETPDLMATVTSLLDGSSVTLGPLPRVSQVGGNHVYRLLHWGRHGESFQITPAASKLLFHPETVTTTLKSDDGCEAPVAVLKGTEGMAMDIRDPGNCSSFWWEKLLRRRWLDGVFRYITD